MMNPTEVQEVNLGELKPAPVPRVHVHEVSARRARGSAQSGGCLSSGWSVPAALCVLLVAVATSVGLSAAHLAIKSSGHCDKHL